MLEIQLERNGVLGEKLLIMINSQNLTENVCSLSIQLLSNQGKNRKTILKRGSLLKYLELDMWLNKYLKKENQ